MVRIPYFRGFLESKRKKIVLNSPVGMLSELGVVFCFMVCPSQDTIPRPPSWSNGLTHDQVSLVAWKFCCIWQATEHQPGLSLITLSFHGSLWLWRQKSFIMRWQALQKHLFAQPMPTDTVFLKNLFLLKNSKEIILKFQCASNKTINKYPPKETKLLNRS